MRGGQQLQILAERTGLDGDTRLDTSAPLAGRLASEAERSVRPDGTGIREVLRQPRSCAIPGWDDPTATAEVVGQRWPEEAAALVAVADDACDGHFGLLGFERLSWPTPIDWHWDPVWAKRAPADHWSRVPFLDPAVVGDHKIIWELNRHGHLVTLAQASLLTGDPRYAATVSEHLTAWVAANPPKLGINWCSSLELALRSIAWAWTLYLLRDSDALSEGLLGLVLSVLHRNGRHIARHLSTYFAPNTHLTGEALGLIYLGTCFPFLRGAGAWREIGWRVLHAEIPRQVLPDGVYYERATWYQRYVADFLVHALVLDRGRGPAGSAGLADTAARVVDVLRYVARPDGTIPLIGDDDGGQLLALTPSRRSSIRGTLATAGELLGRREFIDAAGGCCPDTVWLLGPTIEYHPTSGDARRPPVGSKAFPDGGVFVFRSEALGGEDIAVIDAAVHGPRRTGAVHSHADALSFDLALGGAPLIIDPGTYTYTTDPGWRDHFRNATAHNALTLPGRPVAVPAGPFRWREAHDARVDGWTLSPRCDILTASVVLGEGTEAAIHHRCLVRLAGRSWVIHDVVDPTVAEATVHFHCAPGIGATLVSAHRAELWRGPQHEADLVAVDGDGRFHAESDWLSTGYGVKEEGVVLRYRSPAAAEFAFIIAPPQVTVDAVAEATCFMVRGSGPVPGVLFIRRGGVAEMRAPDIVTDAEVLWLDDRAGAGEREFLALGGTRLAVAGMEEGALGGAAEWTRGVRRGRDWDTSTTPRGRVRDA